MFATGQIVDVMSNMIYTRQGVILPEGSRFARDQVAEVVDGVAYLRNYTGLTFDAETGKGISLTTKWLEAAIA